MALSDSDPTARRESLLALAKERELSEEQLRQALPILESPSRPLREAAIAVFEAKAAAKAASGGLYKSLSSLCSSSTTTSASAAAASSASSSSSAAALAAAGCALAGLLHSSGPAAVDDFSEEQLAACLSAVEALLARRGEEDTSYRLHAAAGVAGKPEARLRKPVCAGLWALSCLGKRAAKASAWVSDALNNHDADVRSAAASTVPALGKEAEKLEPKLLELLQDPVPAVVASAVSSLGLLADTTEPSDVVASAMADCFQHSSPAVRASATEGLSHMKEEALSYIGGVVALLHDTSPSVRMEALRCLGRCGTAGQMYAAQVCRLTQDRSPYVRATACSTLAEMGDRGACFQPELEEMLYDEVPEVGNAAAAALEVIAKMKEQQRKAKEPTPAAITSGEEDVSEPAGSVANAAEAETNLPAALLFPGQGSQYVGMLKGVKDIPAVKEMLEKAKTILGWDLLDLCLNGPEEKLEQTAYCQPVMYVGGLAAIELLKQEKPELVKRARAVAGLSLGEYTALTVAGVFDFETGLRLVQLRGKAMQEAAEASEQLMVSVAGLERSVVEAFCQELAVGGETCQIANFLFPKGFACAGSKKALEALQKKAEANPNCLQARILKTSGAFHTDLMSPAKAKLVTALKDCTFHPPQRDIYMNVTGAKIPKGSDPSAIPSLLADQLCKCVLWEPIIQAMVTEKVEEYYECGPMKQLTAMMKRIDQGAWKKTSTITV